MSSFASLTFVCCMTLIHAQQTTTRATSSSTIASTTTTAKSTTTAVPATPAPTFPIGCPVGANEPPFRNMIQNATKCQTFSGLVGTCQIQSYHVCETPGPFVYCLESQCVLDERRCIVANANLNGGACATQGLAGKCDAVGTCNLDDTVCSTELLGTTCVDNNRVGYCSVDNEQVEALCSRYRGDKDAYLLCEQTLPGAVVCDVSVGCSNTLNATNETCTIRGHDGVCKSICTDYSGGSKSPRQCPQPANGTAFTLTEAQSVCSWSYDSMYCLANLNLCRYNMDQYRVPCVLDYASIYPTTDCIRRDTGCQTEYDFCLENNQGGVCLKNASGLYCHDRSDDCPEYALCNSDTGFALPNNATSSISNATHVVRIGQCSADFYCEPRYVPCDDLRAQSECWEGGLRGKCQPYSYSGFASFRCVLDDTPACSTARLGDACAADGFASECAYSYDVLAHYCPDLESEGCYYTEYGVICHGTLVNPPTYSFPDKKKKRQMKPTPPGDLPAPVSMEECVQRVLAAGEVPNCLTNAYCSVPTMSANDTCTVDGDKGKCVNQCYLFASYTGTVVDVECGSTPTIAYAEISALVTASCNADHQQLDTCVAARIAAPQSSCVEKVTGNTYNRECVYNVLSVSRDVRCVRNDKKCGRVDQFCIENGLSGKCQTENNQIVCHELSDECPAGKECKVFDSPMPPYPYPTKPYPYPYTDMPYYPPGKDDGAGGGMSSGGSTGSSPGGVPVPTVRDGLCSKEYQCMVRNQECGSPDREKCWINGIGGSCISKSKAQDAQLQQCVMTARDPASCYTRYSTCFTKCRFPTQVCGKTNVCEFRADSQSDELVCTAIFGDPGLVAEYKSNTILIQVSGPSIYAVAQLVWQSLSENAIGHLSFAMIDSTIGYVLLGTEQSLTRAEFDALSVVAQQLRTSNGVTDAFVVLGGKPMEPSELCGKLTCADGFKCSDSKCVRVLAHGLCQQVTSGADALCVCELGWRGPECADTDTVKTGETKLSQWVFDKTKIDAATARSKVASAFDSTVDGVRYELVVTDTPDFVTVRVYLMTAFRDLTSAQVEDIRSAHSLLHGVPGLASSNVYFPAPSPVASSNNAVAIALSWLVVLSLLLVQA